MLFILDWMPALWNRWMVWVGRELQRPPSPFLLPWVETWSNRSCCSKPHSTCSRTLPEMEDSQLLWATCFSLTTPRKRFLFHIPNLNLPSFTLKLFPLILSPQAIIKCLPLSFLWLLFICWKAAIKWPWSLFSFRLYSPNFISLSFQSSDHFCGLPLDLF